MVRLDTTGGVLWTLSSVLLVGALLAFAPAPVEAQDSDPVYSPSELTVQPKLASAKKAAEAIQKSYPKKLMDAGIEGSVQVRVIIGTDGRVEASSVQIISADVDALREPAVEAASAIAFTPGEVDGSSVRAEMLIPIVYRVR